MGVKGKSRKAETEASKEVAAAAFSRMGERPGDDDPEAQAEWDSMADAASGMRTAENWGYSTSDLNAEFALAVIGTRAMIVHEKPDATPEDRLRFLQIDAFKAIYQNRMTEIRGSDGKLKSVSWATRWLADRERLTYDGIEFLPGVGDVGTPGYLNLWCGFSVDPRQGGSYAIFRDHLLTNVCNDDRALFDWIFGWFAHMVQNPREKPGTAIVLRGGMGTGKTKVGQVFGSLVRAHHFLIDDPRYLLGQFNSHMAACLFLQAEEAVWAGDKQAEGRLRGLITSEFQMIEQKGVDPIRMRNFVRLLMTSNEDWVVPAGKDERRFATFDVNPRCARNYDYFAEMDHELNSGGREALLYDLLAFDLSKVNLREIPKTEALLEQKTRSLDPLEEWLLDRLNAGAPTRALDHWPDQVERSALYDDYVRETERMGVRRRAGQTQLGRKLKKLFPSIRDGRLTDATGHRSRVYYLPSLRECRESFAETFGQGFKWESDDGDV